MTYKAIDQYTRARSDGSTIRCSCGMEALVYHFAWSALRCIRCGRMVDKHEWVIAK